jgi:hypothetical protein
LELTTVTASDQQLQQYRQEARARLDAWTTEKASRPLAVA